MSRARIRRDAIQRLLLGEFRAPRGWCSHFSIICQPSVEASHGIRNDALSLAPVCRGFGSFLGRIVETALRQCRRSRSSGSATLGLQLLRAQRMKEGVGCQRRNMAATSRAGRSRAGDAGGACAAPFCSKRRDIILAQRLRLPPSLRA